MSNSRASRSASPLKRSSVNRSEIEVSNVNDLEE